MTLIQQACEIVEPIMQWAGAFASKEQEIEYRASEEHLAFIKKLIDENDDRALYMASETAAALPDAHKPDWLIDFQNEILTAARPQYRRPKSFKTNQRDYPLALAAYEVAKQMGLTLYVNDWIVGKPTAAELVAEITGKSPDIVRHAIKKYRSLLDAIAQASEKL